MGINLHSGVSTSKIEYKNAILGLGHLVVKRLITFYLHIEFIFQRLPIGKQFKEYLKIVHSFADDVIMEKYKQSNENDSTLDQNTVDKKKLVLLDLLLEAKRKGQIDLEGVREEVNSFIFAVRIKFQFMCIGKIFKII